ncbi:hypothetical protein [Parvibacter caecicola]|uniref:Archaellum component FlaG (FlaF/FlaG flagellin family) n=1 Tax=Parvibacter caecicola TaxID=747645 RepID=A0A3N0A9S8_9ACTN|nr:hypothetical protein [Parvibacter caecicola]MBB3171839.1 archaellum component FlaG (FlaF/FlaG flagellin family) [Parvibacter caecicola]MCR2040602.1 hypothetical protein [Parvibacter caecicola]RNL10785.1 hypothetical protein DMP11_05935 [Parvibacter caecicola]TJW09974.1 hypothetical protein E5982_07825 [Parvibacter caecicola]
MKKQLLSVAVCGAMALAMFGCSQAPNPKAEGDAPAQQEQPAAAEKSPEELKSELVDLINGQATNVTVDTSTDTTVSAQGQSFTQSMDILAMVDNADGYKGYAKITAPGTEMDGMETFMDGSKAVVRLGDQTVDISDEMADELDDSMGVDNEKAIAIVNAAKEISVSESNGQKTYTVVTDGASAAGVDFDGVDSVGDIDATYVFDSSDQLVKNTMSVEGTTTTQGQEVTVKVDVTADYSDYGTTQVPAVPEA